MILLIVSFLLILFSNWSMDSIKFRYYQSIYFRWRWLRETRFFGWSEFWRSDQYSKWRKYKDGIPEHGRKKLLGIVIPEAFFDGWHFWKMILVGGIIFLLAANWLQFIIFSIAWNLIWYFLYDRNYKTRMFDEKEYWQDELPF